MEYIETIDYVRKIAENINSNIKDCAGNSPISELPESTQAKLLSDVSKLEMSIRESYKDTKEYLPKKISEELTKGISIEQINDNSIRITLPPLIGKQYKGSYNIYWKLKKALDDFLNDNEVNIDRTVPYLIIYKRYITNTAINVSCDNDNWEMKRCTNAISERIKYSDSATHFSFLYTTVMSNKNFTEATLLPLSSLSSFISYLSSSDNK